MLEQRDNTIGRVLVVRVLSLLGRRLRAEVRAPLGLVDVGVRLGARLYPASNVADLQTVEAAIERGDLGLVLAVDNPDEGERVEVLIEEGRL